MADTLKVLYELSKLNLKIITELVILPYLYNS